MIIHLGRDIHYGHYIALIWHNYTWYKYNDNEVSVLSAQQVFDERKLHTIFGGINDHGAAAYIVFYEKVDASRQVDQSFLEKFQKPSTSPQKTPATKAPPSK